MHMKARIAPAETVLSGYTELRVVFSEEPLIEILMLARSNRELSHECPASTP
jgi:hypothetical protein